MEDIRESAKNSITENMSETGAADNAETAASETGEIVSSEISETAASETGEIVTAEISEAAANEEPATDETGAAAADAAEVEGETSEVTDETDEEDAGRPKHSWFRKALTVILSFAAGFAACLGVIAVMLYAADLGKVISTEDYNYYTELSDKFGKYYVIMNLIKEDPIVDADPETITENQYKDIIENLGDPYAAYYTKEEYEAFAKTFQGNYVGVGILVGQVGDELIVDQVFKGSPAEKGGMKEGDKIISVDGTVPEDLDDAVSRITGEEGTRVKVTINRDGKEIELDLLRESIDMASTAYFVSEEDPDIGYIAISLFSDDTDDEFKDAVAELKKKGCSKFIVDLRSNGGGLTESSIEIADYLLPECMIMTEVNKAGDVTEYKSDKDCADLDMVVLVDENTASASEILTAAIKENDAGTIIGTKTFGKGVTQVSHQFRDGTAIKITVTEYLTPKGNHVHNQGIEPDIEAGADDIMDKAIEELNK